MDDSLEMRKSKTEFRALSVRIFMALILLFFVFAGRAVSAPDGKIMKKRTFWDKRIKKDVEISTDQIVIKYKAGVTTQQMTGVIKKYKMTKAKGMMEGRYVVLRVPSGKKVEDYLGKLKVDSNVESAEPDFIAEAAYTPSDENYGLQWGLTKISADAAWDIATGTTEVVVAVVDTGAELNHQDLASQFMAGYDFVNRDSDPTDEHGHGTGIAGIIAAKTDNTTGIAGICWNCTIMPLKALDKYGVGAYSDIAEAIVYAANHGAKVINLSLGGYSSSQVLQDAVSYAYDKGVLLVAAAGNGGVSTPMYPASYSEVIAVASTDENDLRLSSSNYGSQIELSAPGKNIYTTTIGNSYKNISGTSASTAFVSGTAALLFTIKGISASNDSIRNILDTQTVDLGDQGKDDYYGYGRIDALKAIKNALPIPSRSDLFLTRINVTDNTENFPAGSGFVVNMKLKNLGADTTEESKLTLYVDGTQKDEKTIPILKYQEEWSATSSTYVPNKATGEQFIVKAVITPPEDENPVGDSIFFFGFVGITPTDEILAQYQYCNEYNNPDVYDWNGSGLDGESTCDNSTGKFEISWNEYTNESCSGGFTYTFCSLVTGSTTCASPTTSTSIEQTCTGTDYYGLVNVGCSGTTVACTYVNIYSPSLNHQPAAATNVYIDNITSTSVRINWSGGADQDSSPNGLAGFEVRMSNSAYPSSITDGTNACTGAWNASNCTASGLSADTAYYFRVFPYDGGYLNNPGTCSTDAGNDDACVKETTAVGNHQPAAATNVYIDNITSISARINWSGGADQDSSPNGLAGFEVRMSNSAYPSSITDGTNACTGAWNASNCTVSGLSAGTAYYFRVFPYDGGGLNNPGTCSTDAGNDDACAKATTGGAPGAATNVAANSLSATSILVTWTSPTIKGNQVIVKMKTGSYPSSQTDGTSQCTDTLTNLSITCTVTGLTPQTTYYFRIIYTDGVNYTVGACDGSATDACAVATTQALVVYPDPATSFTASNTGTNGQVSLQWNNPVQTGGSGNFYAVKIMVDSVNDGSGCPATLTKACEGSAHTGTGESDSCTAKNLSGDTMYYFRAVSYMNSLETNGPCTSLKVEPYTLTSGVAISNERLSASMTRLYKFVVPSSGNSSLTIETTSDGDVDIGACPSIQLTSIYLCGDKFYSATYDPTTEVLTILDPQYLTYYILVKAYSGDRNYSIKATLESSAPAIPAPILNEVTDNGTSISINWGPITYSKGTITYELFLQKEGSDLSVIKTSGLSYTETTGIIRDGVTQYCYYVIAHSSMVGAPSQQSNMKCVTPEKNPPGSVGEVHTSSFGADTPSPGIYVSWSPCTVNCNDLIGYKVARSTSQSGPYSVIGSPVSITLCNGNKLNCLQYTDQDISLVDNTTYYYKVYPYNDAKTNETSPYSSVVFGSDDTYPPAVPFGISAFAGDQTVTIKWSSNTDQDLAGYKIYRSEAGGSYTLLTPPAGTDLRLNTREDTTVINGIQYCYRIKAYDNAATANESAMSSESACATPNSPDVRIVDLQPHNDDDDLSNGIAVLDPDVAGSEVKIYVQMQGDIKSLAIRINNLSTGQEVYYEKQNSLPMPDSSGDPYQVIFRWNGRKTKEGGEPVDEGTYQVVVIPNEDMTLSVGTIGDSFSGISIAGIDTAAVADISLATIKGWITTIKIKYFHGKIVIADIDDVKINSGSATLQNNGFAKKGADVIFTAETKTVKGDFKLKYVILKCENIPCDKDNDTFNAIPNGDSIYHQLSPNQLAFDYVFNTTGTYRVIIRNENSTETGCKDPNASGAKDVCVYVNIYSDTSPDSIWWFNGIGGHDCYNDTKCGKITAIVPPEGQLHWEVTAGSNRVKLYDENAVDKGTDFYTDTGTIIVRVKGILPSPADSHLVKDVKIKLSYKNESGTETTIKNYSYAVQAPYELSINYGAQGGGNYYWDCLMVYGPGDCNGYFTYVRRTVQDQFHQPLPEQITVSEDMEDDDQQTSCAASAHLYSNHSDSNWGDGNCNQEGGVAYTNNCGQIGAVPASDFCDELIMAELPPFHFVPTPEYNTYGSLGNDAVMYKQGVISIGGVGIGDGVCVEKHRWIMYLDHGNYGNETRCGHDEVN